MSFDNTLGTVVNIHAPNGAATIQRSRLLLLFYNKFMSTPSSACGYGAAAVS